MRASITRSSVQPGPSSWIGRADISTGVQLTPRLRSSFRDALAIREKTLGPEHSDTATSLNNLADLLRDQGDFAGARPLLRAGAGDPRKGARPGTSRHRDQPQQPRHPAARPRATLPGRFHSTSARSRSARRCSAPSIPIRRRASTISPTCSATRATLRERDRCTSGRWRSARRRLGPEHSDTATSLNNLAVILKAQGDFAQARRALRARTEHLRKGAWP